MRGAPAWEIQLDEYLDRLELKPQEFEDKLSLPRTRNIRKIVPLKDLVEIQSLAWMPRDTIEFLIRRVRVRGGEFPFREARISSMQMVPTTLKIGQRFVYRENYQRLLEGMTGVFKNFLFVPSFADLGAHFAFGLNHAGERCLACYLPPIVERHGLYQVIMDGIHRNYIAKQVGKSASVLLVEGVTLPFPCGLRSWENIKVIGLEEKPKDIHERYFDLKQELFRDLKYVGIDG